MSPETLADLRRRLRRRPISGRTMKLCLMLIAEYEQARSTIEQVRAFADDLHAQATRDAAVAAHETSAEVSGALRLRAERKARQAARVYQIVERG